MDNTTRPAPDPNAPGPGGQWPLKKKKKPRKADIIKNLKVKGEEHINHKGKLVAKRTPGKDCKCKMFKCFQNISLIERQDIFEQFYAMQDKNEQDNHLTGLIEIRAIKRRRPRKVDECLRKKKDVSFSYKVRSNNGKDRKVCQEAFLSLHAVTPSRLRRLQNSLTATGRSPRDLRGRHNNRIKTYPDELIVLIKNHIMSFKPRQSHYSRRKNPNVSYLPEDLTIKDMHLMFVKEHLINIPYKIFWSTFKREFNMKFGYPRSDTCPTCDGFRQKFNNPTITEEERNTLVTEKELHLRKAEAFFTLRKKYKVKAQAGEVDCLSFDFMQNLPLPHIPTNPVFFARQLWYYVFGIHNLGNGDASIYTYYEGMAKKGSNDVTSMLLHYFNTHDFVSRDLVLLSDGCPGQNKNYVMLHFLYFVVHVLKIFDSVLYIYPVRGHSYLPNDQDFALLEKQKRKAKPIELPEGWDSLILKARQKPSTFELVKMKQENFFDISAATNKYFLKVAKPPIKIKSVWQIEIHKRADTVNLRDTFSGYWRTSIVRNQTRIPPEMKLTNLYNGQVKISPLKIANLRSLMGYLEFPQNRLFYEEIFSNNTPDTASSATTTTDSEPELEEDDNSSGCEDN